MQHFVTNIPLLNNAQQTHMVDPRLWELHVRHSRIGTTDTCVLTGCDALTRVEVARKMVETCMEALELISKVYTSMIGLTQNQISVFMISMET